MPLMHPHLMPRWQLHLKLLLHPRMKMNLWMQRLLHQLCSLLKLRKESLKDFLQVVLQDFLLRRPLQALQELDFRVRQQLRHLPHRVQPEFLLPGHPQTLHPIPQMHPHQSLYSPSEPQKHPQQYHSRSLRPGPAEHLPRHRQLHLQDHCQK